MAEDYKDIALLADNDIVVEIEVQDSPTVIIEQTGTTTVEVSGDSVLGLLAGAVQTLAKEETLVEGIATLEKKVDNIDFSAIAKEETLKQGVQEIKGYVENIDFSAIAKENTLFEESKAIKDKIDAIEIPVTDLTEVAKEDTLAQGIASISQKVDNIVIPEVDTTPLAKEATLTHGVNVISQKIDDIHIPELDKSDLSKEATLSSGISTISNKIDNIDLSSVENKVDEGVETLSNKIDNIDLSAVEAKVETEADSIEAKIDEGVSTLADKIDNIKLPEIDTSAIAKQGENQEATNTAIYDAVKHNESLINEIAEAAFRESVTIVVNAQAEIQWSDYAVQVTTLSDNSTQLFQLSADGVCTFNVRYGEDYSVLLPAVGNYIQPQKVTYKSMSPTRFIRYDYMLAGVFGIDSAGRRYTAGECEALEDKSMIVAIGVLTDKLANEVRSNGEIGCGFCLKVGDDYVTNAKFATKSVLFDTGLLPLCTTEEEAVTQCDGEAYTTYLINEAVRLGISVPMAASCRKKTLLINNISNSGFLLGYGQLRAFKNNKTAIKNMYNILGLSMPSWYGAYTYSSTQASQTQMCATNAYEEFRLMRKDMGNDYYIPVGFQLPKL